MKKSKQAYRENLDNFSPKKNGEWRFRLKSSTDQITNTIQFFDQYLDQTTCCSPREKNEILTALSEALANAIVHGNKNDPEKYVELKIYKKKNDLKITVEDQGNGFDPLKIPDPTKPENLHRRSGRGIYLMTMFMDDVKMKRTKKGMKITMKKKLKKNSK